jgi:hypothetical protein
MAAFVTMFDLVARALGRNTSAVRAISRLQTITCILLRILRKFCLAICRAERVFLPVVFSSMGCVFGYLHTAYGIKKLALCSYYGTPHKRQKR